MPFLHRLTRTPRVPPRLRLAALRAAGFADAELQAIHDTPAMAAQLRQFARAGGRIECVAATFSGANGRPGLIRFYRPPAPQPSAHVGYGVLAHELGHALFCPAQWRPPASFADAHAYARARELGEAHAWLNQYRLCRLKQGGLPEAAPVLPIENDADFGTQAVDIFERIAAREAAGWREAQILDELSLLNANMFPCGMGEGNFKTYGQCNRWDWLQATASRHPVLLDFLRRLGRPPTPNEQKLLTKLNLFTPPGTDGPSTAGPGAQAMIALAAALGSQHEGGSPRQLLALAQHLLPGSVTGIACSHPAGAASEVMAGRCGPPAHAAPRRLDDAPGVADAAAAPGQKPAHGGQSRIALGL